MQSVAPNPSSQTIIHNSSTPAPIIPQIPPVLSTNSSNSNNIPPRFYNAVYSSVQVYECMVRGIAVMRRRSDSYVNATQILKVAGIDKGRRTKILEKEILPGKHEIVQGGYGKYQGTWIPLERGRDLAAQYGVSPLLAPLFDFIPNTQAPSALPVGLQNAATGTSNRPTGTPYPPFQYNPVLHSTPIPPPTTGSISPAPILPGSALKLLNQGRAQGLFTPSTSMASAVPVPPRTPQGTPSGNSIAIPPRTPVNSVATPGTLKRVLSENSRTPTPVNPNGVVSPSPSSADVTGATAPPPQKRARIEPGKESVTGGALPSAPPSPFPINKISVNGKAANGVRFDPIPKMSTKPSTFRSLDRAAVLRNPKRAAVLAMIHSSEDEGAAAEGVVSALVSAEPHSGSSIDYDIVLDDQGHTALHLASSLARLRITQRLVDEGADVRRGSFSGETPLIRTVLSTHAYDNQTFNSIVALLAPSIRTLDNSRRTVLHHIAHVAGVKGRVPAARYYMDCVLMWIQQREDGDFKNIIDVQDEHGDTALNIAARVGNRGIVKSLVEMGANRLLPNKLGLRPGDFGVEGTDDLMTPNAHDVLSSLRTNTGVPTQKSQDVIDQMTNLLKGLSDEFAVEIKDKQEALEKAQQRLKASTRQLAEQRRQIQTWQTRCNELEETQQRIRNIKRAIAEEEEFDWTGRTEWDGSPATTETAGLAFEHKGVNSTLAVLDPSTLETAINTLEPDPAMPTTDSPASLIRLRRMLMWHQRMDKILDDRLKAIQGLSAEKELQCKKIIALSTGFRLDEVDQMAPSLLIAMESEPQVVDLARIASFMQKVRESEKATPVTPKAHNR